MKQIFTIKTVRYNPETENFKTEQYKVHLEKNSTVLEALHRINEQKQAGISYRYSCGMGLCGSCGAVVNGKPVLLCRTFCKNLKDPIEIRPLKNFPIIKDLIVDTDNVMEKLRYIFPYTDFASDNLPVKKLQSKKERKKLEQTSRCIKCMLCYSACPVFGFNNEFLGPANASTAYRYLIDSRDEIKGKRLDSLINKNGVWQCTNVGECSAVCPKNVDPMKAIQKLKMHGALKTVKNLIKIK